MFSVNQMYYIIINIWFSKRGHFSNHDSKQEIENVVVYNI